MLFFDFLLLGTVTLDISFTVPFILNKLSWSSNNPIILISPESSGLPSTFCKWYGVSASVKSFLLSLVNNATGGEHQCHAIMFKSSYITVIKRYYTPSFDEEFIYVTTKNMSNRYNKIK